MPPGSDLTTIRLKVRRLTRSLSANQLSDIDIDEFINTFILYDFPHHLRLFPMHVTYTFTTQPYVDTYPTANLTINGFPGDQIIISINEPIYIAGYKSLYCQSRDQFFGIYPQVNTIAQIGSGDGATTVFTGTLAQTPVLGNGNTVMFSSINAANAAIVLTDDGAGNLVGDGAGTINYVTGAYNLTFSVAPAAGQEVNSSSQPYVAARPQAFLYFDDQIILRPVPDQAYFVQFELYQRPTALLAANQSPQLENWWQYIAYGAAKKVFENRMDIESINLIMPEYKQQELLVLRQTIVQNTNQRSQTIYTENIAGTDNNIYGWGGPF